MANAEAFKNKPGLNLKDALDFNLDRILKAFINKANDQGILLRSSGVTIEGLSTLGVDGSATFALTLGDCINFPRTLGELYKTSRLPHIPIIRNINGMAREGEMVLVLGRPGAGCSTLLKTIAGETDNYQGTSGDISYNGLPQSEMMKYFRSDVLYNPEYDVHFPHLNVDQTLRFAIGCKTPNLRVNNVSREEYITAMRDILATVFGLRHTFHTKVGNDMVRGVSGGERKRVSIAEALAARASIYCWDNATRGLDASTALEFTQAIRSTTNLLKSVAFITIYQAGEQIYELFDKVTVLYLGRQVYFGPIHEAKPYFEAMGYQCPRRQSTAEFLTAVTDPIGRYTKPGWENRVPQTAEEFEKYWHRSPQYKALLEEIARSSGKADAGPSDKTLQLYHDSFKQERSHIKRRKSRYSLTYLGQLRLLIVRGLQRAYMDRAYTITQVASGVIQGLITGSLYWGTPNTVFGAFSKGGALFQGMFFFVFMGVSEMATVFGKRRIVEKQKNYSFYHPSAESLATLISTLPTRVLTITLFTIIYYFLSNLTRSAGHFFIYYLFLLLSSLTMSTLFVTIAEASPNIAVANSGAGITLLCVLMYSSFSIQRTYMHPWFKWISYINPIFYSFEAMMGNEFHNLQLNCTLMMVPQQSLYTAYGDEYKTCPFTASVPGQPWVDGDAYLRISFDYFHSHIWRNFGIMIGFWVFFIFLQAMASEYRKPTAANGDKLLFKRGGEATELLNRLNTGARDDPEGRTADAIHTLLPESDVDSQASSGVKNQKAFQSLSGDDIFSWSHVDYTIDIQGEKRKLLDDIQGFVKPGTLTALMGESGAGKTTLLNVLSQRTDIGVVTGNMLVNGSQLTHSFHRSTGYVQQQDLHVAELTVRESLRFSARLRRPASVPDLEKLDYVETIIDILGMQAYAEAVVGVIGNGLNVEQRKKLSVGVELVAKPSLLLFLDEPTSGLDSQSAWSIVKLIRNLAHAGQAILCTIHQPSATLFEEFDKLLLLRKGGQTVYFGDIGLHSETILGYFQRNGARRCEDYENPAEYVLEIIGAGATATSTEDWFTKWVNSTEYLEVTKEVNRLEGVRSIPLLDVHGDSTFAMPLWYQMKLVYHRTMLQFWRDPQYVMFKMVLLVFSGLFIGFSFWDLPSTLTGMQNCMFAVYLSSMLCVPLINQIQERAFVNRELYEVRESKSHTFHWATLLFSQIFVELPYTVLGSTFFYLCLYFPLKLAPSNLVAGTYYLIYCICFQLYYISYGFLILTLSPDVPSAAILTTLGFALILTFCGVLQPAFLMPVFWRRFMYHVSPYTYLVSSLVSNVLHDRPVVCSKVEMSYLNPPAGLTCSQYLAPFVQASQGYISNPNATESCGFCKYKVGDEYLSFLGMKHSELWRNVGLLWGYIAFNFFACVFLYWLLRVHKVSLPKFARKA
ncbi:hypothetical protein BABINDRAFT_38339 [Babjeviella inositovora NRRL Y-12698]|uniref:ABC transporter domain-containing protein n=1 Tax=Babjeviella inositovora NRRL Y-12698 TaxID=984486 RepID=A0A1E3QPT0_9ASCO|nr:uncharacterized protein BABINDRAFT_38339 [Babjeviella inositovora NRRL Y-12698]ODQ78977.1 hypothetical protein BABINDRAFT_38339 [Babjeviella inositovora NRRL Y-12698]